MSDPIKHHTVPVNYLKYFSDDSSKWRESQVYVYDVKQKKWRYSIVWNLTVEKNFYTLEHDDWTKSYEIEKFLGAYIDTIPSVISKIDNKEILTEVELIELSYFIVAQELRTQSNRNQHNDDLSKILKMELDAIFYNLSNREDRLESIKKSCYINHNIVINDEKTKEIYLAYESWKKIFLDDKKWSIESMMSLILWMQKYVYGRAWVIVHTNDDINMSFVTSDFPLFFSWWITNGLERMYTWWFATTPEMHIALSKKSYLTMYAPHILEEVWLEAKNAISTKNIYRDTSNQEEIDLLNYQSAFWTLRQLIGNSEKVVLRLAKIIEDWDKKYIEKYWIFTDE